MDMRYTKQAMTLAQQIQTLQGRGLIIADTNKAEQALDAISYFRLADYWYHLEADHHTHQFLPNSHFEEVLACYYFDKDLKALLFKAIQTIEVAVRSKIIKHFAPTCGPFWFMDATKAVNQKRFQTNLDTIKKEVGRSKERYIREHFRKYTEPDLPPVWKTLEVISLGELSKLFNNFSESQLKHDVAHEFGLNHHKFLSSWLESLTSLRNHCAHHARVWNRAYPLKPTTPQVMPNKWLINFTFREESLYAQLCCIAYWLNAIDANNTFVGDLKLLLLRNPSIASAMMGFPSNWRQEPLWQM
ncbi:MAG: Abi family protein [Prevotella sp.]|nr:Abi family protein [Prevotella sp.]